MTSPTSQEAYRDKSKGAGTKPFTKIRCVRCAGNGIVASYDMDGFLSPDECSDCGGAGTIIRYDSGVLAAYPGGPLLGREPKVRTAS